MSEWEIIEETLALSGLPGVAGFDEGRWLDMALPFETAHFLDGFGHADKKFHFKPDWASLGPHAVGLPALPDHADVIDAATDERPFRMVAAPPPSTTRPPASRARAGRASSSIPPISPR